MLNTAVNKLVVAVIGLGVILINTWLNTNWAVSPEIVNSIAAPITAALVWYIPNKKE